MPLLSKEEWRRKERRGEERNLSAACFAAIKTTEVELLTQRREAK